MVAAVVSPPWQLITPGLCCTRLVDYQHSYNALESLTQLCEYKSPCLATRDVMVPDAPPRISLLLSENVHLFLPTRRVLLHIGLRYRQRLQW